MEWLEAIVSWLEDFIWNLGVPVGEEEIPFVVIALLGTGIFLTLRLGFIQLRRLGHGFAVTSGKYDDPNEPGDVSHFQALTTALSATVGIGNIAGVAIAIHWGGPGALFWMWITAFLGMATKYSEVTLAQNFREVETEGGRLVGTVSGGPMYYIERGLGARWKPLAVFFAIMLGFTAFLTGNAVQANTVADTMNTEFGIPVWITGLVTAGIVALVVLGGIRRIGRVTGILAPLMAAVYVLGGLIIISLHAESLLPAFKTIFTEAFNPTAGVAGTGVGAVLTTLMWGVRRGLFSNEAGQGTGPHAASAAEVKHPAQQGLVQAFSVYVDTLFVCSATAFMILITGAYNVHGGDGGFIIQNLPAATDANSPAFTQFAVESALPTIGKPIVAMALFFFAFTTVLAYYYIAETNVAYLRRFFRIPGEITILKLMMMAAVFYGAVRTASLAWGLGDIGVGLMAWLNIVAILVLFFMGKPALKALDDYERQRKAGVEEYTFDPEALGIRNADFWNNKKD